MMELLGELGLDMCAVQSQDLYFGLERLQQFGLDHQIPFYCSNLVGPKGAAIFPGSKVYDFEGKKLGLLAVTDPALQSGMRDVEEGLEFSDPIAATNAGIADLKAQDCDAIVLLYGGRRQQITENFLKLDGVDLILFGNATISQRVPTETDLGVPIYTAASRGKDFGEIKITMKDDGSVEVSPITIHELDKVYPDDPIIRALIDDYNAEAEERKTRAKLVKQIAEEYSMTAVQDTYLGTEICARCHMREFDVFKETAHAQSMISLEDEYQESNPDCISCHVTGWEISGGYGVNNRITDILKNVQCEACHGYGTAHERGSEETRAMARASCVGCHDQKNSPGFNYAEYWKKIAH